MVGTVRANRQDSWFRVCLARDQHDDSTRHRQPMGDYGCMLRAYRRHIVEAMLAPS